MYQNVFQKIRAKGFRGIAESIYKRFNYLFVESWYTMHGSCAKFLWHFFQLFPINQNLILFESEPDYCDNSWALYQYIRKNRPNYKTVWIVNNTDVFKNKIDKCTSFVTRYGKGLHLRTIYYYATARYNFYTHWTFQPYIPRKGQTVINLWHGGYPIKASKVKNRDFFDFIISMGEKGKDGLAKYIGCSIQKVLVLGQPRIDLLVENIGRGIDNPFCSDKDFKKVIIWMPTFRTSINLSLSEQLCDTDTGLPLLTEQDDLYWFNRKLNDMKILIIAKIHHLQAQKSIFKTNYSNFIFLTDDILAEKGIQLYEILGKTDALLTDYSSVVWDYLAVDKPVGFIFDDIEKYEASCGFNENNVKELLKGEHIYNKEQLIQFLNNVLEGKDDYQVERKHHINNNILLFPKGGNCKNIVEYFGL